jgi:hypothetical protein
MRGMVEPPSRKRRIVRRSVLTVATVFLLLWTYLGSWLCMWWLLGRGTLSYETVDTLQRTAYAPAVIYCARGYPGGRFVADLTSYFQERGSGAQHQPTWSRVRARK